MMSIPRDLLVDDPGRRRPVKINAAYSIGGERLAVTTIKTCSRSAAATSRSTTSSPSTSAASARDRLHRLRLHRHRPRLLQRQHRRPGGYAAIDIDPGYQKLCGKDALAYVRYRHGDNDLVRAARQQDFLRQVRTAKGTKQLISGGIALGNLKKLARVFGRYFDRDKSLRLDQGDLQVRQDRPLHGRQPGARGPVPRRRRAATTSTSRRRGAARGDRLRVPRREGVGRAAAPATEPTDEDVAGVQGARAQAAPRQPSSIRGLEEARARRREPRRSSASSKVDFPFYFPTLRTSAAPPTRARSRARTRSRTSAARSTTRTGSC